MEFPNIKDKIVASGDLAVADEKSFLEKRLKTIYPAQRGQLPFVKTTGTNEVAYGFPIIRGDFCINSAELTAAKAREVSFEEVFNTWKRYSHLSNSPYPAIPAELQGWNYNSALDVVSSNVNSSSHIGLVSREKYSDYEIELYLSAPGSNDDDAVGLVLAFNKDETGLERTLTLFRNAGGNGYAWRAFVNYSNDQTGKLVQRIVSPQGAELSVKWGSGVAGSNATEAQYTANQNGGWNGLGRTRVHVKREGDIITCRCSDFSFFDPAMEYVPGSEFFINLNSNVDMVRFRGESSYGYCALSQQYARYDVINFVGGERAVYDLENNVTHVNDGSGWTIAAGRKLSDDLGIGRLLLNPITGKLFYNDTETEFYHLNSVPSPNNIFEFNQTINNDTNDYNLRNAATTAGWDGIKPLSAVVTISPGVVVGSTSLSSYAFDSGTAIPINSVVKLINKGIIAGKGGDGGNASTDGGNAGPGLISRYPIFIDNTGGIIAGGGGGGAGSVTTGGVNVSAGGAGGGGGQGSNLSPGGIRFDGHGGLYPRASNGYPGNIDIPGSGGDGTSSGYYPNQNSPPWHATSGNGGSGGGLGQPGGNSGSGSGPGADVRVGGAPGFAVTGNANITWIAEGTQLGIIYNSI